MTGYLGCVVLGFVMGFVVCDYSLQSITEMIKSLHAKLDFIRDRLNAIK